MKLRLIRQGFTFSLMKNIKAQILFNHGLETTTNANIPAARFNPDSKYNEPEFVSVRF